MCFNIFMDKTDISTDINRIYIEKAKSGFIIYERGMHEGMEGDSHGCSDAFNLQQKLQVWADAKQQEDMT